MAHPVYLLAGDDDHLLRRAVEDLLADLRGEMPDLDVEVREAAEADHLPELRTTSLFGGRRCVVLRGAEALSGDLRTEVEGYLAAPSAEAVLVLVARGTGRIRRIARRAGEVGERRDVKTPYPDSTRGWESIVTDELGRHGREATPEAVAALLEHAGADATAVASKVGQVVAAAAPGAEITHADVDRVVAGQGSRGAFAVADRIAARDPAGALLRLRGALEAGDEPLALLGAVNYRIRQLLLARAGRDPGGPGFKKDAVFRDAARFRPGELAWCHRRLSRLDLELKSSDAPPETLLEVAVVEVATPREVGLA